MYGIVIKKKQRILREKLCVYCAIDRQMIYFANMFLMEK